MIILVDIGNSRIKWACQVGDQLSHHGSNFYKDEEVIKCFDDSWSDLDAPECLLVANVAGDHIAEQLRLWAVQNWDIEPEFARVTDTAFGVANGYSNISMLGIDRWMALIATWKKFQSAACIVDCGTAVTIDGLNARGEHLGGLILPGILLMQQSLYQNTELNINLVDNEIKNMANTTEQGIQSGCILAIVGLIEHVFHELQKSSREKLYCVVTGGDAEKIKNLLPDSFVHVPHLVLEGLSILAREKS